LLLHKKFSFWQIWLFFLSLAYFFFFLSSGGTKFDRQCGSCERKTNKHFWEKKQLKTVVDPTFCDLSFCGMKQSLLLLSHSHAPF
jgi:hypothetical protein